jgi:hypothetical protein
MKLQSVLIHVFTFGVAVPSTIAQTEYTTDGNPTPLEEEIRWHVNRGRFDTARENLLRNTTYDDIPEQAPPLALHHSITVAARHHSEDMAKNNAFQHDTIPGSAYYDPIEQSTPWDRMRAEGYPMSRGGENIAAGYGSAQSAYIGWWNSGGHRRNMFSSNLREIGNGYYYGSGSSYGRYYTMDLGSSGNTHFFTGTLFYDRNEDSTYDQDEPVPGIRIELRVGGAPHTHFDVSAEAGNFTIPIESIPDGATVEVLLFNDTGEPVQLSFPRDHTRLENISVPSQTSLVLGTFTQPSTVLNVGLRDLAPASSTPPALGIASNESGVVLTWSADEGTGFSAEWSDDLLLWRTLETSPTPGPNNTLSMTDPEGLGHQACRFYRLKR